MSITPVDVLQTARFNFDIQARTYRPAIEELVTSAGGDSRVVDTAGLRRDILLREDECSTALTSGVSFPHARTACVSDIVLAVGRSREGILAKDNATIHLLFLIGTPKTKIQEYLMVVGFLARSLRQPDIYKALYASDSREAFLKTFGITAK